MGKPCGPLGLRGLALAAAMIAAGASLAAQRNPYAVKMTAFATTRPTGIELASFGAENPAFLYEGRVDFEKPDAPLMAWEASRVRVDFEGRALVIKIDGSGQVFLDALIDGIPYLIEAKGSGKLLAFKGELGPGLHSLVLFKRSEASSGSFRFRGLEIEKGKSLRRPAVEYRSRMLFLGDSITAGSCVEDGPTDQWVDYSTHNAAKSYANLVAQATGADHQNVSVSGMGVAIGWNESCVASQVWDRMGPDPKGKRADLASWMPDIVFVNLGENDGSFSSAKKQPFPESFASAYSNYLKAIKAAWPKAHIVILRGGMYNGASNPDLIAAIDEVAASFEGDPLVRAYAFRHSSGNHPRAADHRALADELIAFLESEPSLAAFALPDSL